MLVRTPLWLLAYRCIAVRCCRHGALMANQKLLPFLAGLHQRKGSTPRIKRFMQFCGLEESTGLETATEALQFFLTVLHVTHSFVGRGKLVHTRPATAAETSAGPLGGRGEHGWAACWLQEGASTQQHQLEDASGPRPRPARAPCSHLATPCALAQARASAPPRLTAAVAPMDEPDRSCKLTRVRPTALQPPPDRSRSRWRSWRRSPRRSS